MEKIKAGGNLKVLSYSKSQNSFHIEDIETYVTHNMAYVLGSSNQDYRAIGFGRSAAELTKMAELIKGMVW